MNNRNIIDERAAYTKVCFTNQNIGLIRILN